MLVTVMIVVVPTSHFSLLGTRHSGLGTGKQSLRRCRFPTPTPLIVLPFVNAGEV
jgi:hypothetical protein